MADPVAEEKLVLINPERCIGCKACEVACEVEHEGRSYINVYYIEKAKLAVPLNCRHCESAPCMTVCPVSAIRRDGEGFVVMDYTRCIGCRLCTIACPFGIPMIDRELKVMVKCDGCAARRAQGLPPACVATCPADALTLMPLEEYRESKLMRTAESIARGVGLWGLLKR